MNCYNGSRGGGYTSHPLLLLLLLICSASSAVAMLPLTSNRQQTAGSCNTVQQSSDTMADTGSSSSVETSLPTRQDVKTVFEVPNDLEATPMKDFVDYMNAINHKLTITQSVETSLPTRQDVEADTGSSSSVETSLPTRQDVKTVFEVPNDLEATPMKDFVDYMNAISAEAITPTLNDLNPLTLDGIMEACAGLDYETRTRVVQAIVKLLKSTTEFSSAWLESSVTRYCVIEYMHSGSSRDPRQVWLTEPAQAVRRRISEGIEAAAEDRLTADAGSSSPVDRSLPTRHDVEDVSDITYGTIQTVFEVPNDLEATPMKDFVDYMNAISAEAITPTWNDLNPLTLDGIMEACAGLDYETRTRVVQAIVKLLMSTPQCSSNVERATACYRVIRYMFAPRSYVGDSIEFTLSEEAEHVRKLIHQGMDAAAKKRL
eukprot:GHVQ01023825.1.p1 GENE.GHVQ01023825.1~~GHVQ01023825.1.p1  ORF type:complete len:458 (+),score=49.74 GHVQ01023825.1:86-1375(+)